MTIKKRMRKKIASGGLSTKDSITLKGKYGKAKATQKETFYPFYKTEITNSYEQNNMERNTVKVWIFAITFVILFYFIIFILEYMLIKHFRILDYILAGILIGINIKVAMNYDLRKNHAAEHIVLKFFWKTGRVPEIDEVKNTNKCQQLSVKCGANRIGVLILIGVINIMFNLSIPIHFASIILSVIPLISWIGLPFQAMFLAQPNEKNLETAISALKSLVDNYYLHEDEAEKTKKISY